MLRSNGTVQGIGGFSPGEEKGMATGGSCMKTLLEWSVRPRVRAV